MVMETLINSFGRSLLIYLGTPMVAGGLWNKNIIEKMERSMIKKSMMVPQNINPDIITNLVRNTKPAAEIVERLAKRTNLTNERQSQIQWKPQAKIERPKQVKLYIPRIIANQIWA